MSPSDITNYYTKRAVYHQIHIDSTRISQARHSQKLHVGGDEMEIDSQDSSWYIFT